MLILVASSLLYRECKLQTPVKRLWLEHTSPLGDGVGGWLSHFPCTSCCSLGCQKVLEAGEKHPEQMPWGYAGERGQVTWQAAGRKLSQGL